MIPFPIKRTCLGAVAVLAPALLFVLFAFAQAPFNPFLAFSDTGQTVHVLPLPALVRSPLDGVPIFAPAPSGRYTVYPGSYGSGNLINHGGPEIANAAFQAIYWNGNVANAFGSGVTSLNYSSISAQITGFINSFPDNRDFDGSVTDDYEVIQQYGSGATPIANTLGNPPAFVDNQPTQSIVKDSSIQTYLTKLFNAKRLPASANTIYGIYFPAGTKILLSGGASCSSFCGYHTHFTYNGVPIKYAVFPYPNCSGCSLSGLAVADMLTIVSSHEIREAVTDPMSNAWYDSSGYEADDKCVWHNLYQTYQGGFWVQPEFSNGGTAGAVTYPSLSSGAGGCAVF